MNVCIICLRCDRKTKCMKSELVDFHDDICNYSAPENVVYCLECEHLLRKYQNFHKQCIKAVKIYNNWRKKKAARAPLSDLHKQLPPSPLGFWAPSTYALIVATDDKDLPGDTSRPCQQDSSVEITNEIQKTVDADNVKKEIVDEPSEIITNRDEEQNANKMIDVLGKVNEENVKTENLDDNKFDDEIKCIVKDTEYKKDKMTNVTNPTLADDSEEIMENDDNNTDDDGDYVVVERNGDITENYKSDDMSVEIKINDGDGEMKMNDMTCSKKTPFKMVENMKVEHGEKLIDVERLKKTLKVKMDNLGAILSKDGTPIDKQLVLESIEFRKYIDLVRLQSACRTGRKILIQRIQKIYKSLQEDNMFKEVFDIQYMSTHEMKVKEFEKRKTYIGYINAPYKCEKCYLPYKYSKELEKHNKDCHDVAPENRGQNCPVCGVVFDKRKNRTRLYVHMTTHCEVYRCKLCPLITNYRTTMEFHYRMHKGNPFRCELCNASFKWQSGYHTHMLRYHNQKKHVCSTCGRGFGSVLALQVHNRVHKDDPPLPEPTDPVPCAECDVTFPSLAVYNAHTQDVHAPTPTYEAQTPRDSASLPVYNPKRNQQKTIKRNPHKRNPFRCKLCNEIRLGVTWIKPHFEEKHSLEEWMKLYPNANKHLCDVCGRGYASLYSLRDHMSVHTGARPFPCEQCPKRFRTALALSNHRVRHLPPKHTCELCGKKFKSKSNLLNHLRVHTGERSHGCEVCGKRFHLAGNLKAHVRGVHHNIKRVRRT